jgi:hypothetical protein
VQVLHDDDFTECVDPWRCNRPHHEYCHLCCVCMYHADACDHLRDFADGLDFEC